MYRRFLNTNDYLSIITEEALSQLVRENTDRFAQAEQAAEASILDYLSENYEIERELAIGKSILEYNSGINYPAGAFFYHDGKICETLQAVNGFKAPTKTPYWIECEWNEKLSEIAEPYRQLRNYNVGDKVKAYGKFWECVKTNGYDYNDIRIPGVIGWEEETVYDWDAVPYAIWEVVRYEGDFFTLISDNDYDPMKNPMESDCWGMIGKYDSSLTNYQLSDHEYVVYDGAVFYPLVNPNPDVPELGKNIRLNDPRNYNLKRHMVQLSLYELHKLISPTNISNVRIDDYDHSMQWLKDASRLKLNPQIPRKMGKGNKPVTDWQMATFQSEYNPYENPWHI